jgi:hypothetical protein
MITEAQRKKILEQKKKWFAAHAKGKPTDEFKKPELPKEHVVNVDNIRKRDFDEKKAFWEARAEQRKATAVRGKQKLAAKLKQMEEAELRKMLRLYRENLSQLKSRIARKEDGMRTAEQLFNKNKWRETHLLNELADSKARVETYIQMVVSKLGDGFKCPHCGRTYKQESSLKGHITKKHPEVK